MKQSVARLACSFVVTLPWLNPFAPGPYPPVMQWVVTFGCAGFLAAWLTWARPSRDEIGRVALDGWLIAALLSSVIGVVQYLGWSDAFAPWMNSSGLGQAYANLRQRNQFATLCSVGLACLLWGRFSLVQLPNWAALVMAALLGLGSATSGSRTGFVQLLVLGFFVLLWSRRMFTAESGFAHGDARRPWPVLASAYAGFASGLLVLPHLLGMDPFTSGLLARIGGDATPCNSRVALWDNVLHLIALKPWTGWGWGELGFAHYMVLQPNLRFCDIVDNAHNLFLHVGVELGLPVLAVLVLFLVALFVGGHPLREQRPLHRVAWMVLVVILLHSMLEYPLWYGPFLMATGLALATVWPWKMAATQGSVPLATGLVATLFFVLAAYTTWEYHRVSQIFLPQDERAPGYRTDTLNKIRDARLFRRYVLYAELTTTSVNEHSAARVQELAQTLLHFSAEPRVIEKLLDSAIELGDDETLLAHMVRYEAAFPKEYRRWRLGQSDLLEPQQID